MFALSPFDERVFASQNVFLGPTIHLPHPEYYVESHHLHLIHVVFVVSRCVFKRDINPYMFPAF